MNLPESISQFPITSHLEDICNQLKKSPSKSIVLTAETGTGKSTILPLALLEAFNGKILMTEPRRLSVLGVANRISSLRQESCGQTVGYQIHLENKISSQTRLQIVTEAILVRKLQEDQALEDINVVILDEFHERSVQMDLALAFLKEAMELRDDLFVIVMSATIDCKKIADFLSIGSDENGGQTPIIRIPGKTFPVDIEYEENLKLEKVIINNARAGETLLAFLPGLSDIKRCIENLHESYDLEKNNIDLYMLHSSVSLEDQKKILQPGNKEKARVIISSAIAETSLTIPGVTVVVDSGLARINRMNLSTGMEGLFTETESEFSAAQRCGRAGREKAGKCIRLWNKFDLRQKDHEPEILRADLLNLVLECADRGIYDLDKINWLDAPGTASWKTNKDLLIVLNCLSRDGKITNKGREVLKLGIHPRLGCILLAGGRPEDILKYTNYANSNIQIQKRFTEDLQNRLNRIQNLNNYKKANGSTEFSSYLLEGFPDRLAKKVTIEDSQIEYQFANGRKAVIKEGNTPLWVVAPEVLAGKEKSIIFKYEEISEAEVEKFLENKLETKEICRFIGGKVTKNQEISFGKIVLKSKKLEVTPEDTAAAWITEILEKGFSCLPIDDKCESFLVRWEFLNQQGNTFGQWENNENVVNGRQNLVDNCEKWLLPFLGSSTKLTSQIVYDALYWFLEGNKVDEKAPETYILPNNKRVKVHYEKLASPENKNKLVIRPVIEVIIQRIFGCFTTPQIGGMKVLLRLLSPASRPLQITDDLENFWTGAWIEICKEMKGRYPKHNWEYTIVEKE